MQSKKQSFTEALVSTGVGFVVALISQVFIMWFYGIAITFQQNVAVTVFFTGISILRGYAIRRFFNGRHR